MSIGTRAQILANRFRQLVSGKNPACPFGDVSTAFTVYRRKKIGAGTRNALGLQANQFESIGTGDGFFIGAKTTAERWWVDAEGQAQAEMVSLLTAFDLHEGDNVHLGYDNKMYLVEASSYQGSLRYCLLNSTKAMVRVPGA